MARRRPTPQHTTVTLAVVVTMLFGVGVPFASGSTVDELRDDLSETRQEMDAAEDQLEQTRAELGSAAEQVREADRVLGQLAAELTDLEARLVEANATAAGAAARTEEARAQLELLDRELAAAEDYLAEREQLLEDRAVAAFMFGSVSYAEVVVEAESITDFVNTTYYLRTVLLEDKAIIEDVGELTVELASARAEADALREQVESEQRLAEEALATVAALTEEQQRLTDRAASERARRTELLHELEVLEAATEAQLDELAAESAALEEQLRAAQWRAGAPGEGSWVWPTSGRITSPYGYRTHPIYGGQRLHTGVDVSGSFGQTIVAANDGLVVSAYCSGGGYGCRIVLDHGGGMASLYAHQSSFAVSEGEVVTAGQTIGYVGSTGASTGPHLHFEIRREGVPEDPMQHY